MRPIVTREEFYTDVYEIVQQIPAGKVLTYGQIAILLGKPQHSRMVGQALCNAPANRYLPCHRVVNHKGDLAPGWPAQRELLALEGVTFRKTGRVNLQKHLWEIYPENN